jgi:hypothetical protein
VYYVASETINLAGSSRLKGTFYFTYFCSPCVIFQLASCWLCSVGWQCDWRCLLTFCHGLYAKYTAVEDFYLLGYSAVQSVESWPTSARNVWLHLHCRRASKARNNKQVASRVSLLSASCCFLARPKVGGGMLPLTLAGFQRTTRHYTILHNHRCDNLKSYSLSSFLFLKELL